MAELDKAGLLLTPQRLAPRAMEYADLAHLTYLSWVCKAGSLPVYTPMSDTGGLTLVKHTALHAPTLCPRRKVSWGIPPLGPVAHPGCCAVS